MMNSHDSSDKKESIGKQKPLINILDEIKKRKFGDLPEVSAPAGYENNLYPWYGAPQM